MSLGLASDAEIRQVFALKHGDPETTGWAPKRRWRAGYFTPADVYEATVAGCVKRDAVWLDIGGGKAIFPENPKLAKQLVSTCKLVVAVDPSDNVQANGFVHQRVQTLLEDYQGPAPCDLATLRMVVEHVEDPHRFVRTLARVVRPGGAVVLLTVDRRSPVTLVSKAVPFNLHHAIKRLFWGGEEEDTFPAHYLMNSREHLRSAFESNGFTELSFTKLDDLSVFSRKRWLNLLELTTWRVLRAVRVAYPERCLLAIYRRRTEAAAQEGVA